MNCLKVNHSLTSFGFTILSKKVNQAVEIGSTTAHYLSRFAFYKLSTPTLEIYVENIWVCCDQNLGPLGVKRERYHL